ncbi:MAG: hypothetical protein ACYC6Y_07040 [Thermoguttaceae bacterium]
MSSAPFANLPPKITVRPPQFGVRTLLMCATGIGLTFGVLRWFEVSAEVGFFVLAILIVAAVATAGLVAALLQAYTTMEPAGKRPDAAAPPRGPFDLSADRPSE